MVKLLRIKLLVLFVLGGLLIAGCSYGSFSPFFGGTSWAQRTLDRLTLREKIAQMLVYHMNLQFMNTDSDKWQEVLKLVESDGVGGIHIYRGEVGEALTTLNELQKRSKIPIIWDADLEYGLGWRVPGGTEIPYNMAIAATGDPQNAFIAGNITAIEGRAVGIQLGLVPVVDVNNNPENPIINTRSFGEDADLVATFSARYIAGMHAGGMAATAKHFPGHGDTGTDSHTRLATIPSDSARLWSVELPPFKAAIDAGVDLVMIAHLQAPDYQPQANLPATLSPFWIQEILRQKLGFQGVVISDAMSMGGITRNYTPEYAIVAGINAGLDMILQANDFPHFVDVIEQAVLDNSIPEQRINESALRILRLKEKLGLHKNRLLDPKITRSVYGTRANESEANRIAQEAITLVKNVAQQVPLNLVEGDTLFVVEVYDSPFNHELTTITKSLRAQNVPLKVFPIDASDDAEYLKNILGKIPANAPVLVNAFCRYLMNKDRIFLPAQQTSFLQHLFAKTNRSILISLGTPYLLQDFQNVSAYVCTYGSSDQAQRAVVKAILGQEKIGGSLPVTIPGAASVGTGIKLAANPVKFKAIPVETGMVLKQALPRQVSADTKSLMPILGEAIADSAWPGGVLLAARDGKIYFYDGFGYHTYAKIEPTQASDIFDLASVTKVIATTSAVMKLYENGQLSLDDPVVKYVPQFSGPDQQNTAWKKTITIKNLLTHTAGLQPFERFYALDVDLNSRWDSLFTTRLDTVPGTRTVYSDIGLILIGKTVEAITGMGLDDYVNQEIFQPLGMTNTFFNPPAGKLKRVVPTEFSKAENGFIRGHVHDENSYSFGGVTGHAGLFSTAGDLAIFGQMMLNKGIYGKTRIFTPETIEYFTVPAEVIQGSSRCLGWDSPEGMASGGVYLGPHAYGHTGFTGTSIWMDPENQMIVILLTNAVHPNRAYKYPRYFQWRQRVHSAAYECFTDLPRNPDLEWWNRWKDLNE